MYYDFEGTGIQFLKHQILIQISYWISLIPRNCAIAELLTTCKHSCSWQNEHVFSCFTVLVNKIPSDNVRGGGGNGRNIIHE